MNTEDKDLVRDLRDLATMAAALANLVERGGQWPGVVLDQLGAISRLANRMDREHRWGRR